MSSGKDHQGFQFAELARLDDALKTLRNYGIGPLDDAYKALYKARGAAFGKLGLARPRTTTLLKLLPGLSPGEIRLFQDAELGWLAEVTPKPGAQPVRKYISDEQAVKIIKGELTHEEFMELAQPVEEYIA